LQCRGTEAAEGYSAGPTIGEVVTGMSDIKHMDIAEFRRVGFLQEANRLFFHPHGLALEITIVDGEGDNKLAERVRAALASASGMGEAPPIGSMIQPDVLDALTAAVVAEFAPPGSCRLSGVWDYRDDAEGVYYGDWQPDAVEKVENVRAERRRHHTARAKMFFGVHSDTSDTHLLDVEPTTFVEPRDTRPPVGFEGDAAAQSD
jgi:hypothetical protein